MKKTNLFRLAGIFAFLLLLSAFIANNNNPLPGEDPINISWKLNIGENATLPEPVFYKATVFIGTNSGSLLAIDAKNGKLKWEFKAEGAIYSKPTVFKDVIFFTSYEGMLYALFTNTGKVKWKFKTSPDIKSTPAINKNQVVINDGKIMKAFDLETGLDLWKKECINFDYFYICNTGNQMYFSDKLSITSLSTGNCNKLWEYKQRAFGMSEFVMDSGLIFISNADGMYVLNTTDGKMKWKFEFEEKPQLLNFNKPIPAKDIILFPVITDLYAFNRPSGTLLWKFKAKDEIKDLITLGNQICFTDNSSNIYIMNKETHKKPKMYVPDNQIASPFYTDQSNIYFFNPEGLLCAFKIPEEKK
jgi:eukaryotic-like serine/threonine-protein kinase